MPTLCAFTTWSMSSSTGHVRSSTAVPAFISRTSGFTVRVPPCVQSLMPGALPGGTLPVPETGTTARAATRDGGQHILPAVGSPGTATSGRFPGISPRHALCDSKPGMYWLPTGSSGSSACSWLAMQPPPPLRTPPPIPNTHPYGWL